MISVANTRRLPLSFVSRDHLHLQTMIVCAPGAYVQAGATAFLLAHPLALTDESRVCASQPVCMQGLTASW
jgi:hypothetical protein